jgi:hypothetical protein
MLVAAVGAFLLLLGLFSGAVLTLVPLGFVPWRADFVLWVLFPLFSLLGYALVVVGARSSGARLYTMLSSAVLLVLAGAAALGLVMRAASIVSSPEPSLSLWYVLVVAGVLGIAGAASFGRQGD